MLEVAVKTKETHEMARLKPSAFTRDRRLTFPTLFMINY
ncbi:hypothetical protein LEP1GSC170_2597 [Leptospira interrogans serovar Bataviae str. HAI135]|nr:hypothetical protein LEP1GSC170_2597 [Leptospira interrogans serovar Bataviae str. HAI135]